MFSIMYRFYSTGIPMLQVNRDFTLLSVQLCITEALLYYQFNAVLHRFVQYYTVLSISHTIRHTKTIVLQYQLFHVVQHSTQVLPYCQFHATPIPRFNGTISNSVVSRITSAGPVLRYDTLW